MMSTRGPISCKFGVQCHRPDCWYSHPDGRAIDAGGGGGRHNNGVGRGAPMPAAASRPGGGRGTIPGSQGGLPQASPRMGGGGGGSGGGGTTTECRYSFECKRRDCHFNHLFGRAIDADGNGGGGGGGGGRPLLNRPSSNSSMGSITRGISEVSFGSYPPANATDDDQDLRDTWFPKARDCTCCKGYVYGCTSDICESMGQCTCSIEEKDLDGSSSVSSGSMPRTGSPQIGMGANGNPMGMAAGAGGLRAPHPATEAAMGAGAGARGSARGGGGTECRYGTGCKRADCSYNHSQGRCMDADGVSFGDFGPRGGGNKHGGGRPSVDQDLMDTWYPDSRECTCCKGYKHGCKTAACAEAGLCSVCVGAGPPAAFLANSSGSPPAGGGEDGSGGVAGKAGLGEAEGKHPPPAAGAGVVEGLPGDVANASETVATS